MCSKLLRKSVLSQTHDLHGGMPTGMERNDSLRMRCSPISFWHPEMPWTPLWCVELQQRCKIKKNASRSVRWTCRCHSTEPCRPPFFRFFLPASPQSGLPLAKQEDFAFSSGYEIAVKKLAGGFHGLLINSKPFGLQAAQQQWPHGRMDSATMAKAWQ